MIIWAEQLVFFNGKGVSTMLNGYSLIYTARLSRQFLDLKGSNWP